MQNLKLRSGLSEMGQKTSPAPNPKHSPSRTTKGSSISSDSSESRSSKVSDRKSPAKSLSMAEKKVVKDSDMQQLQEELKKVKEERSRALEELSELKKKVVPSKNNSNGSLSELEKAKDSERKMLESLVSQTKQLEQTKISLEEAKLEIRSLKDSIKSFEGSAGHSSRNLEKHLPKDNEVGVLRNELRLAMEAEEKSKKAMDDLAIALKEVTTESSQAKARFAITQSELEKVTAEAESFKSLLKVTEGKLLAAVEESERLKLELEESTAAWNAKENGFIDCMKISEEEISKAEQENGKLIESQRSSREENAKLRDIIKQAVNEATVVKEALEIARTENSELKDLVSEKENALQSIRQEYENLKVSEAAALDSVKELKRLLAATSDIDSSKTSSLVETGSFGQPLDTANDEKDSRRMAKFPSGQWKGETRIQNGRRHSVGEPGKFKGSAFDTDEPTMEQKDQMLGSLSNVSHLRVPSSLFTDDRETLNSDHFDHTNLSQLDGTEYTVRQKKKKTMLRRFGDLLRRKSFHKQNSSAMIV